MKSARLSMDAAISILRSLESQLTMSGVSPNQEYEEIQITSYSVRLKLNGKTLMVPLVEMKFQ